MSSTHIREDADPEQLAENQIPPLAASSYREKSIQDYLIALGGDEELTVNCVRDKETACIKQNSKEVSPTIYIPARNIPQPISDYPQETYTRILQYGMGLHEFGHDQFTDQPYWVAIFDRESWENPQYHDLYWDLCNCIEDHRIEKFIIQQEGEWAEQRLDFTNISFVYTPPEQVYQPNSMQWGSALVSAAIHYGKARGQFDLIPALEDGDDERLTWNSSKDEEIYQTILPWLKSTLSDVECEPDGKHAVDRMIEFIHRVDTYLSDESEIPNRNKHQEQDAGQQDSDKENDAGGQKSVPDVPDEDNKESEGDEDSAERSNEEDNGDGGDGGPDNSTASDGNGENNSEDSGNSTKSSGEDEETNGSNSQSNSEKPSDKNEGASEDAGPNQTDNTSGTGEDQQTTPNGESENGESESSGPTDTDTGDKASDSSTEHGDENLNSDNQATPQPQQREEDEQQERSESQNGTKRGGHESSSESTQGDQTTQEDGNSHQKDQSDSGDSSSTDPTQHDDSSSLNEDPSDQHGNDGSKEDSQPNDDPSTVDRNANEQADTGPQEAMKPDDAISTEATRNVERNKKRLENDKQQLEEEIKALQKSLSGGPGNISSLEMVDIEPTASNTETWNAIKSQSQQLKPILRESLQRVKQTNSRRGTRTGKFDSKLSRRVSVGNYAINRKRKSGDEKQYAAIVVLDRSGSMRGEITQAERATGGFADALEDLGIDVAIIDLYKGSARMVKPFNVNIENIKRGLTSGNTGGGTPLTDALVVSRERVKQEPYFPFLFVISDGRPNEKDQYKEELSKTNFPVLGVNIGPQSRADEFDEYYDESRTADVDDVGQELSHLARSIMF
jgi:Mg-chelatase subunit ChlD